MVASLREKCIYLFSKSAMDTFMFWIWMREYVPRHPNSKFPSIINTL